MLFEKYKDYRRAFYTAAVLAVVALVAELMAKRPMPPNRRPRRGMGTWNGREL